MVGLLGNHLTILVEVVSLGRRLDEGLYIKIQELTRPVYITEDYRKILFPFFVSILFND